MDCPYTGKGEEFSPTELIEAALGGCMLLSMGTFAMRHDIDLIGTRIDVKVTFTDPPGGRLRAIDVSVDMPPGISEANRAALERAADGCPIKHSFAAEIPVHVSYTYPTLAMV